MPFSSPKQRNYLFKHHPALAKKWAKRYGSKPKKKPKVWEDGSRGYKKPPPFPLSLGDKLEKGPRNV